MARDQADRDLIDDQCSTEQRVFLKHQHLYRQQYNHAWRIRVLR
jgi:hypothetical protein